MGLDVYVGSLTRYCVESPADVVERIARHQGVPAGDGQDAEEVVRAAVVRRRGGPSRWLGDRLAGPLDWDESGPAPCFTDKPGWDGYGGALLAAHDEHPELPPPAQVSADWPDDPAYQAASARGAGSRYAQLLTPSSGSPGRAPAPGRGVGRPAGADEARLLRRQPQNRLWAANRASGSQATRGPRYIRTVR